MSFGDYFIHGGSFAEGKYGIEPYLKDDCTTLFCEVSQKIKNTWERFSLYCSGIGIASSITGITAYVLLQPALPVLSTIALVTAITFSLFCLMRAIVADAEYKRWDNLPSLLIEKNWNIVKAIEKAKELKVKCDAFLIKLQQDLDNKDNDAVITDLYVNPFSQGPISEFPKEFWAFSNTMKKFTIEYSNRRILCTKGINEAKEAFQKSQSKLDDMQALFITSNNNCAEGIHSKDYMTPFRDAVYAHIIEQFTETRLQNKNQFDSYISSIEQKMNNSKSEVIDLTRQLLANFQAKKEDLTLPSLKEVQLEDLPVGKTCPFTFDAIPEHLIKHHTELLKKTYDQGLLPPERLIPDYINQLSSVVQLPTGEFIYLKTQSK